MGREVEMARDVEAHIGILPALIVVAQHRGRGVEAQRMRIGKGAVHATIVAKPSADVAVAFKIVRNVLRPGASCAEQSNRQKQAESQAL